MGVLGIVVGSAAVLVLSAAQVSLSNVYLASLFGSTRLHLDLSWTGAGTHLALTVVLGAAAVVLPVRKALAIQPVKAIARDQ